MDEEITRQTSVLFNINAQRNAFSFVFRLPTRSRLSWRAQWSTHSDCAYWVNVSYVCRHWRHVALNSPTLWTYLFITSPRWTEELLARSKQTLLKLHVNTHDADEMSVFAALRFVEQVMNYVERIQELQLYISLSFWGFQFFHRLSSPAARLQKLVISAPTIPLEWGWSLESVLFSGDTPALCTLELSHCPVSWYSLKLSGLTTLSLPHVPVRFQQNTEEFLASLRCMQDLTDLHLDHALDRAAGFLSSAAFDTFQKISLPCLSRL